jgi:hypothetical protein
MDLMMMKDYPDFSHEGPELSAEDQVSTIKYKILNFSNLKNFGRKKKYLKIQYFFKSKFFKDEDTICPASLAAVMIY